VAKVILHVEDEENDVLFFSEAMAKAGSHEPIQVATDGRQAIDYLTGAGQFADRAQFPLPYLVLLDLKLPVVPGLEVLKWIRSQPDLAPIVVVLTSSEDEVDVAAAYRLGANAYLVKPNRLTELLIVAKAIKDFWLSVNQPPPESPDAWAQASIHRPKPASLSSTEH
jgi:CheY-like chemotaxis protein